EQLADPTPVFITDGPRALTRGKLRVRHQEGTSAEPRLREDIGHRIEHSQYLLARAAVPGYRCLDARAPRLLAPLQVRAHQLLLAAEGRVQRGLGHTRVLQHAVDAHIVDAVPVEELISCGEQA